MASGCRTSPPARHGSFHPLKDDGGGVNKLDRDANELDMASGCRTSPPQRGTDRSIRSRTMGVGLTIARISTSRKNMASGTQPPQRGTDRSIRSRTMGVGLTIARISTSRKNMASGTQPPPTPPARHGSFHPLKDDGGGVNDRKDLDQPKKYGFRYSTPSAARIVPSAQGRWGWG